MQRRILDMLIVALVGIAVAALWLGHPRGRLVQVLLVVTPPT